MLLFDEPTSALDPELVGEVLRVIRALADEGRTMLLVTHELGFAYHVATRVLFLADGVIHEQGTPDEVLKHPTPGAHARVPRPATAIQSSDVERDRHDRTELKLAKRPGLPRRCRATTTCWSTSTARSCRATRPWSRSSTAGFVLGDGVWEGLRLVKGRLISLDAHMDRLFEGARSIDLDIGLTRAGRRQGGAGHARPQRHDRRRASSG